MFPEIGLLVLSATLSVLSARRDRGPLTYAMWLWSSVLIVRLVAPLQLERLSARSAIIIAVGLVATFLPQLLPHHPFQVQRANPSRRGVIAVRLVILSAFAALTAVLGAIAFRNGVAAATGAAFDSLSLTQIRRAQTTDARGGGFGALLAATQPILACLGVYGAVRFNKLWLALTVVALGASMQTPGRTMTIALLVMAATFYAYVRRSTGSARRSVKRPPVVFIVSTAAVAAFIFNSVGEQLGKNDLVRVYFPHYWWPDWTLSGVMYLAGGPSALTVALRQGVDPFEQYNSVFILVRAAALVDPLVHVPDTLGDFVGLPIPFNVFTSFGQVYFDFGIFGVASLSFVLGWLAVASHRRALSGSLSWAWISSVGASLLFYTPAGYRLFTVDLMFQLLVGAAGFWWLESSRKNLGGNLRGTSAYRRRLAGLSAGQRGPE